MARRHSFFVSLAAVSVVLATGNLSFQTRSSTPSAPAPALLSPSFVPQSAPLPDRLQRFAEEPLSVLDIVLETLDPKRIEWLGVSIRQQMTDDDVAFEARSRLVLGPNYCARLETALTTGRETSHVIVVSDGAVFAHVTRFQGQKEVTNTKRFPRIADDDGRIDEQACERMLSARGCIGPHALLLTVRNQLRDPTLTTGLLDGMPALLVCGSLDPLADAVPKNMQFSRHANVCRIFLDPESLLPIRLEWRRHSDLLLEMHYADWRLNQPLSEEECAREFTFEPAKD